MSPFVALWIGGSLLAGSFAGQTVISPAVCHTTVERSIALAGRVDSLVAAERGTAVWALLGAPSSQVRFLPHDSLAVLLGQSAKAGALQLPAYIDAPGVAASPDGRYLYALIDSSLLTIDSSSATVAARQDLRLQAIGWPAALTVGPNGDLYLIGQPAGAMAAQAYAFRPDSQLAVRLLWRTPLGLTHAGAWLGLAGNGKLAVYSPDQSDARGVVGLFDTATGILRRSYALSIAPVTASAALNRLYTAGAGVIRALALDSGVPIALASGDGPLAVGDQGLVAFTSDGKLVLARGGDLRRVLALPFPGSVAPTALALRGSTLLVGNRFGITQIQLDSCHPA